MLGPTATLIVDWLRQIGLTVSLAPFGDETFLPGVTLEPGGIIVDPERLATGDHVACAACRRRIECWLRHGR
jgi:hypothetical protein